jgi:hypothetical protein
MGVPETQKCRARKTELLLGPVRLQSAPFYGGQACSITTKMDRFLVADYQDIHTQPGTELFILIEIERQYFNCTRCVKFHFMQFTLDLLPHLYDGQISSLRLCRCNKSSIFPPQCSRKSFSTPYIT